MVLCCNNNKLTRTSRMIKIIGLLMFFILTFVIIFIPLLHITQLNIISNKIISDKNKQVNHQQHQRVPINENKTFDSIISGKSKNAIIRRITYYEESALSFLRQYGIYYNLFDQFKKEKDNINMKSFLSHSKTLGKKYDSFFLI